MNWEPDQSPWDLHQERRLIERFVAAIYDGNRRDHPDDTRFRAVIYTTAGRAVARLTGRWDDERVRWKFRERGGRVVRGAIDLDEVTELVEEVMLDLSGDEG